VIADELAQRGHDLGGFFLDDRPSLGNLEQIKTPAAHGPRCVVLIKTKAAGGDDPRIQGHRAGPIPATIVGPIVILDGFDAAAL
jgi:hypothetical protein